MLMLLATPQDAISSRIDGSFTTGVDDTAGNGPRRYGSLRWKMPSNSSKAGLNACRCCGGQRAGQISLATTEDAVQLKSRGFGMRVDDGAGHIY
jgi:hypothetical protein